MTATATSPRKPRIALMGEFSAGKSTLSNLLLGAKPLPEKVTATRLSPVWISHGTADPYRIDVDGHEEPVSLDTLEDLPVEETRSIRLFFQAEILELCDLIDFPGISDPNMDSEVWERMLSEVDAVFWCTHATQAWRQSEAAVWETIPQAVKDRSTLLITRFDKITNDSDRERVMARVNMETEGQFCGVFPISLTQALAATNDADLWQSCGAATFFEHMIDRIIALGEEIAQNPEHLIKASVEAEAATESNISDLLSSFDNPVSEPAPVQDALPETEDVIEDVIEDVMNPEPTPDLEADPVPEMDAAPDTDPIQDDAPDGQIRTNSKIIPRRVKTKSDTLRERPRRPSKTVSGDMLLEALGPREQSSLTSRPEAPAALKSVFSDHD